jgi:hypothetical protein
MRLERVKRWQWVVLAVVVGVALAYARRSDPEAILARRGEGVADQRWFEQELLRQVPLADGSTLRAFDRLTVYPLTLRENGLRKSVHVVAGMDLVEDGRGARRPALATRPSTTGNLRPYFFIAPVPFRPLTDPQTESPAAGETVMDYLESVKQQGVTYRYAWWADARYAAAAWVGGSVLLVGVLWPTLVNLLAFGTLCRPREEKGVSLWRVKASAVKTTTRPVTPAAGPRDVATPTRAAVPAAAVPTGPPDGAPPPRALVLEPVSAASTNPSEHKEFGARRDDFYPTELKAAPPGPARGGGH